MIDLLYLVLTFTFKDMTKKIVFLCLGSLLALLIIVVGIGTLAVVMTYPKLPSLEVLTDYRPKMPLRIYTADGVLIGEFGEERRLFTPIDQVPEMMKKAILAAEDERFYQHGGIDYVGVARAAIYNAIGSAQSGASTITMQVARNFFLSREKTYTRKFNEALLAFKIEHNLSKDQILELYFNQIYLGQRAYGFTMAAQTYFNKPLNTLTIAEMAMLAGLPKAPASFNPIANPKRAKLRQLYVLRRMHELGFIDDTQYTDAQSAFLDAKKTRLEYAVHAEYVAEMVRQTLFSKYKEEAYTKGFQVYTTIDSKKQNAAYEAVREGVMNYDYRKGYRGAEGFIDLTKLPNQEEDTLDAALEENPTSGELLPAVILQVLPDAVRAYVKNRETITIAGDGLRFAQKMLSEKITPATRLRPGSIIRVKLTDKGWRILQIPQVESAFVSIDPKNGAIKALVGGFDFHQNNFNHVIQAWRQPGSSFKPFIYSAALEKGITPSTLINDAPISIDPGQVGGQRWEPKNYGGGFSGPISVRQALIQSKNLVSIRLLQAITPAFAQHYITRFGFNTKNHPAYLTMALGAGSVTPLQMAEAYAVFANTGYYVPSYFIDKIEDSRGRLLAQTQPFVAGDNAKRTLDPRNAYIMNSMMRDVASRGTAAKSNILGRNDLAGKTGTTNDFKDAWFAGYQPSLVAVVWMGYDHPRSLGTGETGGGVSLPIWINYMAKALRGVPAMTYQEPEGLVTLGNGEVYLKEHTHTVIPINNRAKDSGATPPQEQQPVENIKELLF
jgi:penicillin-binding protein 1A